MADAALREWQCCAMICGKCEVAGYINEEANEQYWSATALTVDDIRELALAWHGMCKGKGCCCQHKVGDVIDPLAVSTETRRAAHAAIGDKFRKYLEHA